MLVPSSFTSDDQTLIESNYASLDAVASALENHDESVANSGDLLSYYIVMTGTLPDFMSGAMLSPDDPELATLWADEDFSVVVQDWRFLNLAEDDMTTTVQLLEDVEETLGDYDVSAVDDATQLWEEYEAEKSAAGEEGEVGDGGTLLTDMMSVALKWGNPGLALLFYIMGSETAVEVPEDEEALNVAHAAGESESITAEGSGVTIDTENGPITADYGDTVYFRNQSFGEVVLEGQDTVISQMEDEREYLEDDLYDQIGDISADDEESSEELERVKGAIEMSKNKIETYTNIIQVFQDALDTLTETASSLIDSKRRVEGAVINRF